MEENKPKDLKNLVYKVGDVTDLKKLYPDESFDVIVDKGTYDAIATDERESTIKMCQAYFNEAIRTLKNKDGVFIIVSLLQPHVLKMLFDFFVLENDVNLYQKTNLFQVKVLKIENIEGYAEKQFLKYFVAIKKNFIDVSNPKMVDMRAKLQDSVGIKDSALEKEEFYSYTQAIEKIKVDQQIFMIAPTIKLLDPGRQIEMHCFDYKSKDN